MKPSLKDHQNAMAALLASGSAIPTSASRLAHAVYDMLAVMNSTTTAPVAHTERRSDATTSGLNDAALAYEIERAARAPAESNKTYIRELEQLIKMRDNTIRQLRESNKAFRAEKRDLLRQLDEARGQLLPEQAGCRKEDTEDDGWIKWEGGRCPVGECVRVEVMWRDRTTDIDYASCYDWSRPDGADPQGDIVAYRMARP